MLQIEDLDVYYGEIHALKGVGLEVRRGGIVTILGNTGAGTTSGDSSWIAPAAAIGAAAAVIAYKGRERKAETEA